MSLVQTPVTPGRTMANFRDLGGLPAGGGRRTRHGVLLRSDAPYVGDLPPEDAPGWPPSLVPDLREPTKSATDHPLGAEQTEVLSVPLLDPAPKVYLLGAPRDPLGQIAHVAHGGWRSVRLEPLYLGALRRIGATLPDLLERIVTASGPVLVHCAAGKDRTGALVAVLLRAAGVSRDTVLADYLRTEANMPGVMARMEWDLTLLGEEDRLLAQHLAGTSTEAITGVLDALDDRGVQAWLEARGVSGDLRERWERRLLA